MDLGRIGLLIASAAFLVILVLRLRPRLQRGSEPSSERGAKASVGNRAEERVYKRLRKLPLPAQRRVIARLEADLRDAAKVEGNEGDDEPVD